MTSPKNKTYSHSSKDQLEPENGSVLSLPWDKPPLCWLSSEQQMQFNQKAETHSYKLGEKIWSQDDTTKDSGSQFLIIEGKVRLKEEDSSQTLTSLIEGDWFGNLIEKETSVKAIAASKTVVVVCWDTQLWQQVTSVDILRFWQETRSDLLPETTQTSKSISGYPFVTSPNTGAACLTMIAYYFQIPTQLDWVKRQLQSSQPQQLITAGEKLGLQIRKLQVEWTDLRQLNFPALLQWQNQSWVVVYGVQGSRLIIGNPLNPCKRAKASRNPL